MSNPVIQDLYNNKFSQLGPLSKEYHVSPDGNDSSGDGSQLRPFATIGAALSYVNGLSLSSSIEVIINVHNGTYTEDVTITRSRTHLIGCSKNQQSLVCQIAGNITVNPAGVTPGNVFNEVVTLKNFLIGNSNISVNGIVSFEGTSHCTLIIDSCKLTCSVNKPALQVTNDPPTPTNISIVRINDSVLSNSGSSPTIDLQTSSMRYGLEELITNSGAGPALKMSNDATGSVNLAQIESVGGTDAIVLLGTANLTLNQCLVQSDAANSNGVNIASGTTFVSINNIYNVPSGSGFAVKGVLGGAFAHAYSVFLTANNKISTAMGAGVVALGTSITLA